MFALQWSGWAEGNMLRMLAPYCLFLSLLSLGLYFTPNRVTHYLGQGGCFTKKPYDTKTSGPNIGVGGWSLRTNQDQ